MSVSDETRAYLEQEYLAYLRKQPPLQRVLTDAECRELGWPGRNGQAEVEASPIPKDPSQGTP